MTESNKMMQPAVSGATWAAGCVNCYRSRKDSHLSAAPKRKGNLAPDRFSRIRQFTGIEGHTRIHVELSFFFRIERDVNSFSREVNCDFWIVGIGCKMQDSWIDELYYILLWVKLKRSFNLTDRFPPVRATQVSVREEAIAFFKTHKAKWAIGDNEFAELLSVRFHCLFPWLRDTSLISIM